MHYRPLGMTGIRVSNFALGTMAFGQLGTESDDACVRVIHRALGAGINLIDTADYYSRGGSEQIVGRAIRGRRDQVVLSTKCFWPMSDDPNDRGLSRRWITLACQNSLRRLGTDWIDVFYMHKPDPNTDIDESLGAMSDLVRQGKVRAVGLSTFPVEQIVEAQWAAERGGHVRPRLEPPPYSIFTRHIERDVLPVCERYGMGVLVWGPLNGGRLTGKYARGADRHAEWRSQRWDQSTGAQFDETRPAVVRKLDAVELLSGVAAGISTTCLRPPISA